MLKLVEAEAETNRQTQAFDTRHEIAESFPAESFPADAAS